MNDDPQLSQQSLTPQSLSKDTKQPTTTNLIAESSTTQSRHSNTDNYHPEDELIDTDKKPTEIKAASIMFWMPAILSLLPALTGIVAIEIMRYAAAAAFMHPANPYWFLPEMSSIFIVNAIVGTIQFLGFGYAALRLSSGSQRAWKLALIMLISLSLINTFSGFFIGSQLKAINMIINVF